MGIISIAIYRGKTNLIHDYHQTNVTDKAAYGRAFGKAMLVITASLIISGAIALFASTEMLATISLAALFVGLIVGIACIVAVQKKYNGGMF
jgi:uncharacterized membrane-anchored protein